MPKDVQGVLRHARLATTSDGVSGFASALYFGSYHHEAILAVLLFFEWRRRRIRLPFVMALAFFVAMHGFLTPIADSPRFAEFAKWFAQI